MNPFFLKIKNHKEQNLPFVLYSKPNTSNLVGILQQNNTLFYVGDYSEKGFVFASFDEKQLILIPENESEILTAEQLEIAFEAAEIEESGIDNEARLHYEALVSKGIQAIKNDEFKKVVLSRSEEVTLSEFDFVSTFQHLIQLYPTTFSYVFFHPKIGLWMGATPEQLIKVENNHFETVSLAGTHQKNSFENWSAKEIHEQQIVTDYILDNLFAEKEYYHLECFFRSCLIKFHVNNIGVLSNIKIMPLAIE